MARWWRALPAPNGLPSRADLDPLALRGTLPKLWLVRWDRRADSFVYRLAGEDIRHVLGFPVKDHPLESLMSEVAAERVAGTWRALVQECLVAHQVGQVYAERDRALAGERLMVPLAGADGDEAFVLGVTDVDRAAQVPLQLDDPPYGSRALTRAQVLAWKLD